MNLRTKSRDVWATTMVIQVTCLHLTIFQQATGSFPSRAGVSLANLTGRQGVFQKHRGPFLGVWKLPCGNVREHAVFLHHSTEIFWKLPYGDDSAAFSGCSKARASFFDKLSKLETPAYGGRNMTRNMFALCIWFRQAG